MKRPTRISPEPADEWLTRPYALMRRSWPSEANRRTTGRSEAGR